MDALGRLLASATAGSELRLAPCVIASVTPPTITVAGVTIPALFLAGVTYAPAALAVAFIPKAGIPVAFPTIGA